MVAIGFYLGAMERLADEPAFGESLGREAVKLRGELTTAKIADKFLALAASEWRQR